MHGRLKVKTTAEQAEAKAKEQGKKLKLFQGAWQRLIEKRSKQEYDREVLELSGEVLSKIPDFSTLWNIRKETLLHMKTTLETEEYGLKCKSELSFTEHCLQVNPKSYGCWEHRCWVMVNMPEPDWELELTLCNRYLDLDERNFHCWDYRRFIVKKSAVPAVNEFQYTTDKITANFSNFSSWHYRSKLLPVIHSDATSTVGIEQSVVLKELNMVQSAFFTDPNDQSAWFYHRWLLGRCEKPTKLNLVVYRPDEKQIILRFTKPVNLAEVNELTAEYLTENTVFENLQPISIQSKYSLVWTAQIDNFTLIRQKLPTTKQQVQETNCEYWTTSENSLETVDFSAATKDVLVNELDMLQQLHDLEPDNKWAMLTIISMMRCLDPVAHMSSVILYLDKLAKVDPYRINYYNDMQSKYTIENSLRELPTETVFNLSSQKLTTLYYPEQFLLVTSLDVSNNRLVSLKGVNLMLCLKTLNASYNDIRTVEDIGNLPQLEVLDLRRNKIAELKCIEVLKLPKLKNVDISENPVMEASNIEDYLTVLEKLSIRPGPMASGDQ